MISKRYHSTGGIGERTLEVLLRRDRRIMAAALAALTIAAWGYVLSLAQLMRMPGMATSTMRMDANPLAPAMIPHIQPWSALEFAFMFLMWVIMMVGMMTPSAAPMVLLYARVRRQAIAGGAMASAWWLFGGYLLAWVAFSLGATIGQWALDRAALLNAEMRAARVELTACLLVLAGCYQLTAFRNACLAQCQAPLVFIQRHGGFRKGMREVLAIGFHHGAYCVGCCWALMLLLFGFGVMNIVWVAATAAMVLLEKALPPSRLLSHSFGIAFIVAGFCLFALR